MNVFMIILIASVAQVEGNSSGGYADNGRSYGPLCVTKACVDDVNRIYGTRYKWPDDMASYSKSADVFVKYTSREKDFAMKCQVWNKGYKGKNKRSALLYASKVMKAYSSNLRRGL